MEITPSHPTQSLLFYLAGDYDDFTAHRLEDLIAQLENARQWTISPPESVDETDQPDKATDEPVRTVGGVLQVYSAIPPWGELLPRDADLSNYLDCEFLVGELEQFSRACDCRIEFQLGDAYVGSISGGRADKLLSEGLLGEWKRALGS